MIFGDPYTGWPPHRASNNGRVIVRVVQLKRCEGLNVQVTVPSDAWITVDTKSLASPHRLLLIRHDPELTISLTGDRVGIEANETTSTALADSKSKMKAITGATILPGEHQLSSQNIQGIAYSATAEQDGTTGYYAMWVASRNGFNYRLAIFGEKKFRPAIDTTMHNFVQNLKQIDPARIAHTESRTKLAFRPLDSKENDAPHEPRPFSESLIK